MQVSISCSHKDDINTAVQILTDFGDATHPVVTANESSQIVYADINERLIPKVEAVIEGVNAQADEHSKTFIVTRGRELAAV